MPEDMPDRMPEDMSDRMPEDLPVTKCINVMVGITRSKILFVGEKMTGSTSSHSYIVYILYYIVHTLHIKDTPKFYGLLYSLIRFNHLARRWGCSPTGQPRCRQSLRAWRPRGLVLVKRDDNIQQP